MNDDCRHRPSCANPQQHHLRATAELWPELEDRLGGGGTGDDVKIDSRPGAKLPIDTHVADVMHEIQAWVTYLCRVLLDETDWKPPVELDTPGLLQDIAKWRVGHFLADDYDEMARLAFIDDAEEKHALAFKTARPSGVRRIPLHVRCMDHGTNDQGERMPCEGEYYALLLPWRSDIPDMICSEDETHRMTPLGWQRAQKKTNLAGIVRLSERMKA